VLSVDDLLPGADDAPGPHVGDVIVGLGRPLRAAVGCDDDLR
jgi:hypothetical protein